MDNQSKNKVNFSDYADTYKKEIQSSINFIGQDVDFFIGLKANLIIDIAKKHIINADEAGILDIGCGIGLTDRHLSKYFKNLHGVDVEEDVVEKAKKYNPHVKYRIYDGTKLPFDDNSMDLVFAINVMHHIPPAGWNSFMAEIYRVTKKGGIAVVFEHNPLNPLTRLAVSRCEFDRDAVLLHKKNLKKLFRKMKFSVFNQGFIVFFPFKNSIFRKIESYLKWLPLGAQFYLLGKK